MAIEDWLGPRFEPLLPPPPLNALAGFNFGAAPGVSPADPAPSADEELYQQLEQLFEVLKNWRQKVIVSIDGRELGRTVVTFFDADPGDLETWLSRCGFDRPGAAAGGALAALAESSGEAPGAATGMPPVALSDGISYLWSEEAAAPPAWTNPYRLGEGETQEDWQHRLFDSFGQLQQLSKQDPAAAADLRAQMNAAIEELPGFSGQLGAYLQNIDPELYADPQAYLAAHGLPADTLKELPREQVDIVHAEGTDPISAFIQGNGNHFVKIAADGKIYDISGLVSSLGFGAYKAPPVLATLYARNSAAQQQFEARQAIESGDPKRIAGVLIGGSALEPALGAIKVGAAFATKHVGSPSAPVARPKGTSVAPPSRQSSEPGAENERTDRTVEADGGALRNASVPDAPRAAGGLEPVAGGARLPPDGTPKALSNGAGSGEEDASVAVRFGPGGEVYAKLPARTNPFVLRWRRMNGDGRSNRVKYMGRTPSKESWIGRQVQERMRREGTLVGEGDDRRVLGPDGKWYAIDETDMGHIGAAVDFWNSKGRFYGPRAPEVREFMNDPKNYVLEPSSVNRSKGASMRKVYLPPATALEKTANLSPD